MALICSDGRALGGPWAKPPAVGDILWCQFTELPQLQPGPRPRPALVLQATSQVDGVQVTVVYRTAQKLQRLASGEFAIRAAQNPAACALAGLSFDTRFNFKQQLDLPWTSDCFKVPPKAPQGQTPQWGTLHPCMMQAARAAFLGATGA